jgi:competence protein ComGD
MASFVLIELFPLHEVKETEYFLEQLSNDLQYLQQYAISNQTSVHVQFDKDEHRYYAYLDNFYDPFFSRSFAKEIDLDYGTFGNYFIYYPSGNITKSGAMFIHTNRQRYRMVFLLGKGRFYAEQL